MKLSVALVIAGLMSIATAVGAGYGVYRIEQGTITKMKLADANARADAFASAKKLQHDQDQISTAAAIKDAEAREKIVTKTQLIIQEVPIHVSPRTDARFPLSCGFIRVFDAAVANTESANIPNPAGKSDGDAC